MKSAPSPANAAEPPMFTIERARYGHLIISTEDRRKIEITEDKNQYDGAVSRLDRTEETRRFTLDALKQWANGHSKKLLIKIASETRPAQIGGKKAEAEFTCSGAWTSAEEQRVIAFCRETGKEPNQDGKDLGKHPELAQTFKTLELDLGRTYEAIKRRWYPKLKQKAQLEAALIDMGEQAIIEDGFDTLQLDYQPGLTGSNVGNSQGTATEQLEAHQPEATALSSNDDGFPNSQFLEEDQEPQFKKLQRPAKEGFEAASSTVVRTGGAHLSRAAGNPHPFPTLEADPADASGADGTGQQLRTETEVDAKQQELAASLAALQQAVSAAAAADAELTNIMQGLEVTRNALKGQREAVQASVLDLLEAAQREKETAQKNAQDAVTAARQRTELAADALRTHPAEWTELNRRGFEIEKQEKHGIQVNATAVNQQTRFEPIFNGSDPAIGQSSHRLQGRRHKQSSKVVEDVASFQKQAQDLIDRRGWSRTSCGTGREGRKTAKDAYALRSVAACKDAMQFVGRGQSWGCTDRKCKQRCERQRYHGDAAPPKAFHDPAVWAQWCRDERNPSRVGEDEPVPPMPAWGDVPLVMLLATQDGTPFCVRPFDMDGKEVKLTLDAGDLIIFRGDLAHAGAEFFEDNLRLHVYIDSPVLRREKDTSFPA